MINTDTAFAAIDRVKNTAYNETHYRLENAVFNNREARIQFAKVKKNENPANGEGKGLTTDTVKLITERGKDVVKFTALAVIGVYAAIKTIDTASQVIVKKTKSADQD